MNQTPLPKKLGIKEGARVRLVGAPTAFERSLGSLPDGVTFVRDGRDLDVIVFFTRGRAELERRFESLAGSLQPAGGLWIAWPKKSSGVETDLSQSIVMEIGLRGDLVDNKNCAIDETWTALRFVVRKAKRPRQR